MATPGYPQMGQMPPTGGPPMGGPPTGGPPMGAQRPMRRGTSKAVPIVVSAGLAVGVFCGLLFGVGKKAEAVAAAPSSSGGSVQKMPAGKPGPAGLGATKPAATGSGSAVATTSGGAAGSAAGSGAAAGSAAAGSAAGSAATPAVTAAKTIKLTVTLKPEAAMEKAKLYIDGKEVEGMTVELPADKKSVKVEVKSSGYHSVDKKIDLSGGEDMTVEFETVKRSPVRQPKRPDKPPSNPGGGGGGLIDI